MNMICGKQVTKCLYCQISLLYDFTQFNSQLWSPVRWRKARGIVLHTKCVKFGRYKWQANSVIDLWFSGIRVASSELNSIRKRTPQQMSCLLWNSRLIKQQQSFSIFWYRGPFKALQILRTLSPKLSQLAETLSTTDPKHFMIRKILIL